MSNCHHPLPQTSTCSQKKIDANRNNSANSTGPRTTEGKAASKWNAVKHGLTSSHAVVERIDGEEARKQYEELYHALRERFDPQDPIADYLVKRIADNIFRLHRFDRMEAATLEEVHIRTAENNLLSQSGLDVLSKEIPGIVVSPSNLDIIRTFLDRLSQMQCEMQRDGAVSLEILQEFMKLIPRDQAAIELVVECVTANSTDVEANDSARERSQHSMFDRAAAMIAKKIEELQTLLKKLEEYDQARREAHLATCSLPPGQLENLWRYRSAINKELERDLAQLGYERQNRKEIIGKQNKSSAQPTGDASSSVGAKTEAADSTV